MLTMLIILFLIFFFDFNLLSSPLGMVMIIVLGALEIFLFIGLYRLLKIKIKKKTSCLYDNFINDLHNNKKDS